MAIGGLSKYGIEQALASTNVMPSGTSKYVALLTTLPSDTAGTGLAEATGSGYARIALSNWATATVGNKTTRKNNAAVTFAALTGSLAGIVGWALYSAVTGGNLIAFGSLVDGNGDPVSRDFITGDQPRFSTGELQVSVQPE